MSRRSRVIAAVLATAMLGGSLPVAAQGIQYPTTRRDSVVDNYFGTKVPAPYRWFEDQNSPEVAAWVKTQNAVTFAYLDTLPQREAIRQRLTTLWNYEKVGVPQRVAKQLFYSKNSGLQNQSVIYTQATLGAPPRELLDPNTLSPDGSVALQSYSISPDGRYMAYGLSQGGSDWEELHVRTLDGRAMPDTVRWVKYSGIGWTNDGNGFFYSRFPEPPAGQVLTAKAEHQQIYYHVLGTPQSDDRLIYERKDLPDWYMGGFVSEDGRYFFISMNHGTDPKNLLYYVDLKDPKHPDVKAPVRPLYTKDDAEYSPIGNVGHTLYLQTSLDAPKRRIVAVDLATPDATHWRTVVPEGRSVIDDALLAGGRVVVQYLVDAKSQVRFYSTTGKPIGQLTLPGIGAVTSLSGRNDTQELFYGFTSFLYPTTVFHYSFATGKSSVFQRPHVAFDPSKFETKQVFYRSKDGTRVPMFITAKKGVALDGANPTVLYAYGGFDISVTPSFNPMTAVWLEMGGIYAVANLRGGGEYGEAWHHAGMLTHKQNVFNDFISAAEYLIAKKYTSPKKLAIHGYSNGGLLVGATMTQRPDLFAVAYPGAGVMDMLRYQKFTAGIGWVPEYGSSDDSTMFRYIYKYSPVQNVKPGTCYPATIVTTADHDDRVVPSHSYKFIARLQAAQSCDRPVLIRVETETSHGYMPTDKRIAQLADIWAFTAENLGVRTGPAASTAGQ
ncbi:MAG TPA: prolyl oligopeptidase family serine peptidase [Gemmatimonadaceae bacterium]|nr:prolyl oligopeptidase family serine peptidase [Gemmatimonadaceae bacterium]